MKKQISEKALLQTALDLGAENEIVAKAVVRSYPDCHCEAFQKIVDAMHLREAKWEREIDKYHTALVEADKELDKGNINLAKHIIKNTI